MATLDDTGARRLSKQIKFLDGNAVRFGWITNPLDSRVNRGDANDKMRDDRGITTPTTVAEVARAHELGRGNVPERSMLKGTMVRRRKKIAALQVRTTKAVIAGRVDAKTAMSVVGEGILTEIKDRMVKGIPPPLTERRKREKKRSGTGKDTPLINWGVMLDSVRFKIVKAQ